MSRLAPKNPGVLPPALESLVMPQLQSVARGLNIYVDERAILLSREAEEAYARLDEDWTQIKATIHLP